MLKSGDSSSAQAGGIKIMAGGSASQEGAAVLVQAGESTLRSDKVSTAHGGDLLLASGLGVNGGDVMIPSIKLSGIVFITFMQSLCIISYFMNFSK